MNLYEREYLLGRVLVMNGKRWRILRFTPDGYLHTFSLDDERTGGRWVWAQVRELIRLSMVEVE